MSTLLVLVMFAVDTARNEPRTVVAMLLAGIIATGSCSRGRPGEIAPRRAGGRDGRGLSEADDGGSRPGA